MLTCLMSLYALVMAVIFRSPDRWICFAAMFVSSLGDIVLMNFKGLMNRSKIPKLYIGAVLFMIAHVLYFFSYLNLIRAGEFSYINAGFIIAIIICAAALISLSVLFTKNSAPLATYIIAFIYVIVIALASTAIFSLSFSMGKLYLIAALGSLSFIVSDYFIGLNALGGISRYEHLIWWFYPIGQILIITFA